MSILTLLLVFLFVGIGLYLINRFVPMDAKIKIILNWTVVIFLVIWLLKAFGIFSILGNTHV